MNSDYVLPLFNSIINEFTLGSSFDHDTTPGWLNIKGPVVQKVDKVIHRIASFSASFFLASFFLHLKAFLRHDKKSLSGR